MYESMSLPITATNIDDDKLLKILIDFYSKRLYKTKLEQLEKMFNNNKMNNNLIENDLIRVEYYNDFNSCLCNVSNVGKTSLKSTTSSSPSNLSTTTKTTTTDTATEIAACKLVGSSIKNNNNLLQSTNVETKQQHIKHQQQQKLEKEIGELQQIKHDLNRDNPDRLVLFRFRLFTFKLGHTPL